MLQEIVEGSSGSFQLSQPPSHKGKEHKKFLIPQMSPHRRPSSKGNKDKGRPRPESPSKAAQVSANTTPRLSMTSCGDQESVGSEASSSFHDSLAS